MQWIAFRLAAVVALFFSIGAAAPAGAQLAAVQSRVEAPSEEVAQDPFGRSTPAGTVSGFIEAIADEKYALASRYLDLSEIPAAKRQKVGAAMAQALQKELDRAGQLEPRAQISDEVDGSVLDGLAPELERVGRIGSGDEAKPVLLERVTGADGNFHWVVSGKTLDLPFVTQKELAANRPLAERWLPPVLTDWELRGAPASHWLTLVAAVAAAFAVAWIFLRVALFLTCRFASKAIRTRRFIKAISAPLALLVAIIVGSISGPVLGASIVSRQGLSWILEIGGWLACGWLAWRFVDAGSARILDRLSHKGRLNATGIVRFAGRLIKLVIIAITFMAILDASGFNVTAAVAALGIGGLALALGAQKTVENLIASVSIISDRPFRIGEICRFGTLTGTVEDIGMRSSRIRTLDRTLLTIPNSSLSNSEIENYSRRDRGWFHPILHLSTATPPQTLQSLLSSLRAALEGDFRLDGSSARVRLLPPTSDRLAIEVFGYILTSDYDEFLAVQEELMLELLGVVADHQLVLTPPAVHLSAQEMTHGSPRQLIEAG